MQSCLDRWEDPRRFGTFLDRRLHTNIPFDAHLCYFRATEQTRSGRRLLHPRQTSLEETTRTSWSLSPVWKRSTAEFGERFCTITLGSCRKCMQPARGIMNSRTEVAHLAVEPYALEKRSRRRRRCTSQAPSALGVIQSLTACSFHPCGACSIARFYLHFNLHIFWVWPKMQVILESNRFQMLHTVWCGLSLDITLNGHICVSF